MNLARRGLARIRRSASRAYLQGVETAVSIYRGRPPGLNVARVSTQREFDKHIDRLRAESTIRSARERALSEGKECVRTLGYCFVCSRWATFSSSWAYSYEQEGRLQINWREQLECPHCGLNNRMRAAIHLAAEEGVPLATSHVYATEQVTQLFQQVKLRARSVVGSEFLGDAIALGACNAHGVMNQDLTKLTFADNEFDLILCFEVLEHVPNYVGAFEECARVLKPGGKMMFSAPFDVNAATNQIRARVRDDGTVEHIEPPEYHGDPLSDAGCLCYQKLGWEMLDQMKQAGFRNVYGLLYYSTDYGYLGGEQIQFIAEK